LGYNEAVSLTFISHEDAEAFSDSPVVELANPISEEASIMRTSMVPGMLNMLAYNLNRGVDNVRLFEVGHVFQAVDRGAAEVKSISLGATGSAIPPSWNQASRPISFFDLKGDIETLLRAFQYDALCYDSQTPEYYHPGRSARAIMDGVCMAQFGQIHPEIAAKRKLRQDIYLGEIYLDRLYKHPLRTARYEALPRYPAVEKIQQAVGALGLRELRSFVPVEVFRGGKVPVGKYSILLRATFQSGERTLREDEVADWSAQIVKALESLGGGQRT